MQRTDYNVIKAFLSKYGLSKLEASVEYSIILLLFSSDTKTQKVYKIYQEL